LIDTNPFKKAANALMGTDSSKLVQIEPFKTKFGGFEQN